MSLYEFTDLNVGTSAVSLPSESITFNGHKLDSELVGYQTLNVEGRSSFTRSLSTATGLADGDLFLSSRIESNKINVKYMVSAKTNSDFNTLNDTLNKYLQGNEVAFNFADEPNYMRYGTVTANNLDNAGQLSTTGVFEITMSDPYKYGATKSASGTTSITVSDTSLSFAQGFDTIVLTNSADVSKIVLTVDGYTLTLVGSFKAANVYTIDYTKKTITEFTPSTNVKKSVNATIDINNSDIFEAKIKNGTKIASTQASSIMLSYRVKAL
ncbi:distal tail protein Dit [Leuconostoc mesenteroides]|uniref:distal tail protein Dit n=1 Tax=Leuconostoc mesenteroides TaxID=1245 RepID=UPI00235DD0D4|nr:distal tail protein Dit [Leuconostoc mesenteroides]